MISLTRCCAPWAGSTTPPSSPRSTGSSDADLLISEGAGSQANYRFKHALIQDAAYESLLKSSRQALHRRAAEILVGQPEPAAAEPEVIAHHFTQAGLDELAIEWWSKAGDQALRRSAFQEAIAHLGKAIAMADKAAGPAARAAISKAEVSQRVKLQNDYAQAVLWSKGYAADETKAAFERTSALAARAELPAERFSALHGRFLWSWIARGIPRGSGYCRTFSSRGGSRRTNCRGPSGPPSPWPGLHATGRLARGANPTRTGA